MTGGRLIPGESRPPRFIPPMMSRSLEERRNPPLSVIEVMEPTVSSDEERRTCQKERPPS